MANPLNVYKGPESVRNYFDPDSAPPLPLVELPDALNPYRQDGVRIYAKMMTMHPTNNVKSMPGQSSLIYFEPRISRSDNCLGGFSTQSIGTWSQA